MLHRSRSILGETAVESEHDSDWDTVSEEELTMDCPPTKNDVSKLTQIPLSKLATAKSVSWLSSVITFKHVNKNIERIMVRILIPFNHPFIASTSTLHVILF